MLMPNKIRLEDHQSPYYAPKHTKPPYVGSHDKQPNQVQLANFKDRPSPETNNRDIIPTNMLNSRRTPCPPYNIRRVDDGSGRRPTVPHRSSYKTKIVAKEKGSHDKDLPPPPTKIKNKK